MFVKPKEGLKILRPDTRKPLAACGEYVPKVSFWLRRVKDGDVILCEEAVKKKSVEPVEEIKKPKKKKEKTETEVQ